jgi:hypothetical protein
MTGAGVHAEVTGSMRVRLENVDKALANATSERDRWQAEVDRLSLERAEWVALLRHNGESVS